MIVTRLFNVRRTLFQSILHLQLIASWQHIQPPPSLWLMNFGRKLIRSPIEQPTFSGHSVLVRDTLTLVREEREEEEDSFDPNLGYEETEEATAARVERRKERMERVERRRKGRARVLCWDE